MTEYVTEYATKKPTGKFGADLTTFCGRPVFKAHFYNRVIEDIINHQKVSQITTVGIQGKPGSGKTTLARAIAHSLHRHHEATKQRNDWYYRLLFADDLVNFEATMASMPSKNRVLYFDDISFLEAEYGKAYIQNLKAKSTKIRHLENNKDVRIILLYGYHYTKGLDKYLRDTDFRAYLTVTPEEVNNITDQLHADKEMTKRVKLYQRRTVQFRQTRQVTMSTKTNSVTYEYDKPGRLAMWTDGSKLSTFIFSTPEMINGQKVDGEWKPKDCMICANLTDPAMQAAPPNSEKVIEWVKAWYSEPEDIEDVLRYLLFNKYGYIARDRRRYELCTVIERMISNGAITLEKLIEGIKGKSYLEMAQRRAKKHNVRIKTARRMEFAVYTGQDGLKSRLDKELTGDEINKAREAMEAAVIKKVAEATKV